MVCALADGPKVATALRPLGAAGLQLELVTQLPPLVPCHAAAAAVSVRLSQRMTAGVEPNAPPLSQVVGGAPGAPKTTIIERLGSAVSKLPIAPPLASVPPTVCHPPVPVPTKRTPLSCPLYALATRNSNCLPAGASTSAYARTCVRSGLKTSATGSAPASLPAPPNQKLPWTGQGGGEVGVG